MRLIDADALIPIMKYTTTDNEIGVFPIRIGFEAIKGIIDEAPTIDTVEIVRCKDCEFCIVEEPISRGIIPDIYCRIWESNVSTDGYCNYGEKQITGKLESVEKATSEDEESTMGQPKSKLDTDIISRQAAIEALTGWQTDPTDEEIVRTLKEIPSGEDMGEVSDGYHTFNQLYHQRAVLFATIVNQNKDKAWKSWKHEDGKFCFDKEGEWFIVGIDTLEGSYTYHYEKKYWDLFDCEELDRGKHWDGHTEEDVTRLLSLPSVEPKRPKGTETMMVDGEPTEIDPLSYEVGYTHGQSERPKGKYIKGQNGEYYCSACRRIDDKYSVARYCWYCGADMRGNKE